MNLQWLPVYMKVHRNRSRSSGQKLRWAGRRIRWFGTGRGNRRRAAAVCLKSIERNSESFQTAASKQRPKQARREKTDEKGVNGQSECAGKRGGDRATSNAQ